MQVYRGVRSTEPADNVTVTAKTKERVKGVIIYPYSAPQNFDVKHDGRTFAVGSGSSKQRFYFRQGGCCGSCMPGCCPL